MTKYKKSLMSLAAVFALSSTAVMANYIPLSSAALDNQWVILGVSGVISNDGAVDAVVTVGGEFTITPTSGANTIEDPTNDDVSISGLAVTGGNIGELKVIDDTAEILEVRVDTTDIVYLETDPVRTMYVDVTAGDAQGPAAFAFSYKASLEGKRLEYSVNGAAVKYLTISSNNTFDNPEKGLVTEASDGGSDGDAGNSLTSLLQTAVDSTALSIMVF